MSFDASDTVFFFGAGASAPFGIPTMKQMVVDFEKELSEKGTQEEIELYNGIKNTLETDFLGESVDLEAVFTVIDGLINYDIERLGLLSLYKAKVSFGQLLTSVQPSEDTTSICKNLRRKFQNYIREKCLPPEESFDKIAKVYRDFFNRLQRESTATSSDIFRSQNNCNYCTTWTMFTTNYDTCLEHHWRQVAKVSLNTGSRVLEATRTSVLDSDIFSTRQGLRLFKLHGSISWLVEPDGTITEEQSLMGRPLVGRHYVGEVMIYPVQQKELYLEPYVSMLKELNRQLKEKSNWIIIGYSFNDPVIREIFVTNSNERKRIVLLHPDAQKVKELKLKNVRCKNIALLNQKFGEDDFASVDYTIVKQFKDAPRFKPSDPA